MTPTLNRELKEPSNQGAPCLYNEATLDKAKQYADTYDSEEIGHKVPSIAGLGVYLGVTRETIYQWKKKFKPLSDTIDMMMMKQEQALLNNGLDGTFNAHITKLVLSKHGYNDNANQGGNIQIVVSRDGIEVNQEKVISQDQPSSPCKRPLT